LIPVFHSLTRISQLRLRLRDLGAKPCHEDRVLRGWTQNCSYDTPRRAAADYLPLALRNELPALEAELAGLAQIKSEHHAGEGVARLLVELHDGQMVESVLLPRGGLCVSTQVGCAVGCVFCMSGRDGLQRQLGSAEIVAQVVLARQRRKVDKVVFMGMGEPAHNLDNVLEAIEVLGTQGNIGHKNLVLSTVGDLRVFERLMSDLSDLDQSDKENPSVCRSREGGSPVDPINWIPASAGMTNSSNHLDPLSAPPRTNKQTVKPALAISLHSTDDALRAKLLPHAPRIAVEELVERAESYARATRYPTQYQWTLIEGINDGDAELERIVELLSGKYAIMNFIPFNHVDGLPYRRPSPERLACIVGTLKQRGLLSYLRDSAGQEIEGACGQLRARTVSAG